MGWQMVKVLKSVGCLIKYSELNIKHRAAVHILKSMQQVLFHLPADFGTKNSKLNSSPSQHC